MQEFLQGKNFFTTTVWLKKREMFPSRTSFQNEWRNLDLSLSSIWIILGHFLSLKNSSLSLFSRVVYWKMFKLVIYLFCILSYILVTVYRFQTGLSQIFLPLTFVCLWHLNLVLLIFNGSTFVAVHVGAAFTISSVGEISMLSSYYFGLHKHA